MLVTCRRPPWPGSPVISTRNCSRTVRNSRSIFPRPCGRPGVEWVSLMPSTAQAAQQPRIDERGAVIDVDPVGDAVAGQGGPQRGGEADGVLGVAEPVPGDQPRVVIDEREKVRFPAADHGPVQRVAGPHLVGAGRLEPAEHRRRAAVRAGGQLQPREVALQGPLRR